MEKRDVIIIGGGPAGATAAIFLLQRGYHPLIVESGEFPRFHIGESLQPATQPIWDRMGIVDALQHSGYEFKLAARIMVAGDPDSAKSPGMTIQFGNVPYKHMPFRPFAYQVERARFDKQLLDTAVERGAEVLKGTVTQVRFDSKRATGVMIPQADGTTITIEADFIIDASGRRAIIARQLETLERDTVIHTSACFAHFDNVSRDSGQGFFEGYVIENGWVWFIPFVDNKMSFGVVQNKPQVDAWPDDPNEVLLSTINRHASLRKHFANATQLGNARMIRDLAYHSTQLAGDGWIAIGDAAFFIDPLFSTGVHIAFKTAEEGAKTAHAFLSGGRDLKVIDQFQERFTEYQVSANSFMQAIYRQIRTKIGAQFLIWYSGTFRHNFNDPLLRRVLYWLSGNYESYRPLMRLVIGCMNSLSQVFRVYAAVNPRARWRAYDSRPDASRLIIPKVAHADLGSEAPIRP